MKIRVILGVVAALMFAEPLVAVAAPANGVAAQSYSTLAAPLASDEAPAAKVEKAWWVRRYWVRRYWYRPVWRRWYWRRRWYY